MTGYTEEDVRLVAARLDHHVSAHTDPHALARVILGHLSAAGRLVPPGSETREEWITRRWYRDEADGYRDVIEPNERVAREILRTRISARTELLRRTVITTPPTPWSPVPDTNQEEERLVEGGHAWSPPGDIQQCVNCHLTRAAYFATSVRRPCPRRPKEETSALV